MKKQAILIQCHNKPEIVNYLTSVIPDDKFDFFIHVDKKSDIFDKIIKRDHVFFSERVDVRWGRFSQVQATMALLNTLSTENYSYIHLISGNDFIIKSPEEIHNFFENNNSEYIESRILPGSCTWSWQGMDRYSVYYPQFIIHRPSHKFFRMMRIVYREFIMRTKIFKRKKFPTPNFYGGSSWFSITGDCAGWIKTYLKTHPEYTDFFKHGVCIDEVFFSTIVRLSPFADNISDKNLRFIQWNDKGTGGPSSITVDDIPKMVADECIFARKFTDFETIKTTYEIINNKIYNS